MTYDGHGRLATRKAPIEESPTLYAYNADDTAQKVTDPRGASRVQTKLTPMMCLKICLSERIATERQYRSGVHPLSIPMKYALFCICLLIVTHSFCMDEATGWTDTYSLVNKPVFRSVRFVDDKHGWIVGYQGVFHSSDGGRTWRLQPVPVGSLAPREGQVLVQNIGLIAQADQNSCIIRTEKGLVAGRTNQSHWATVSLRLPDPQRLWCAVFQNQERGWAVVLGSPGSVLYGTANGGLDWEREFKTLEVLHSVFAVSQSEVWAVGGECKAVHSTDGGQTWKEMIIASGRRSDSHLTDFHAVSFVSPQKGWISGLSGTILRTTDGGNEWIKQDSGFSKWTVFSAISFADENEGWVVGSRSYIDNTEPPKERIEAIILHTNDGGLHWLRQGPKLEERLLDVQALSNGRAWIVGEDGTVLRTADHGKNWTRVRVR
jgi:photosystem II stability/assembly factor-like uncharacterized protein